MSSDAICRCELGTEFLPAGEATRLCQHSSLQQISEVKAKLKILLQKMDANLDLSRLYVLPPNEGVDYYIDIITKGDTSFMDLPERSILTTAFLRDYTILTQYAMVETMEEIVARSL